MMKEIEGRPFVFPEGEPKLELSQGEVEKILRVGIERVAEASKSWWLKSDFVSEQLGGVDYVHPEKIPGDVGITSPEFPIILERLMEEYGVSSEPILIREVDLSQLRGMEDIGHVFEYRTFPTRIPSLAFESVTQLDKKTRKIMHIWWRIQVIVPGTIISEEERRRIGRKIIKMKPDGEPTAFWEATGDWWNNVGLAKVGSEVARRFLDEFWQKTEEEKEQLLAQFEEEIKQQVYPAVLVLNEDLRVLFAEHTSLKGWPGAAIYQEKKTGQLEAVDLKAPRGERVRRVSQPLEINNRPQLTFLLGKRLDNKTVRKIDDFVGKIKVEIIGLESIKVGPLRILHFQKELFHQGRGAVGLEVPNIDEVRERIAPEPEELRGRIEMTPRVDPEWWRGEIAKKFEEEMRKTARKVVSREEPPQALSETIDKFLERVDRLDPKGFEALLDNPQLVPQYSKLAACQELWEHWWHDLGREDFPIPSSEEELLEGKTWEELGEKEGKVGD